MFGFIHFILMLYNKIIFYILKDGHFALLLFLIFHRASYFGVRFSHAIWCYKPQIACQLLQRKYGALVGQGVSDNMRLFWGHYCLNVVFWLVCFLYLC